MSSKITLDRLAAANPAPDHGIDIDDSKLLLAIQERSVAMSTNTERKATRGIPPLAGSEPPKRQRGWIVVLAAFAAVMIVGLVTLLGSTSTDSPSATVPVVVVPSPSTTVPVAVVPTPTEPTTAAVAVPLTVEIEAFDYGYTGFDTEFNVGDTLELFNSSESEYHSLIVIKISDDYPIKTIEEVIALDPTEIWLNAIVDSFGRRLHAAPGTKATGRIRFQTPGTYIALDWLPQNADPEAISRVINPTTGIAITPPFEVDGGPPGYQHGMIVEFEVGDS
jgi:hypothetical protein